MSTPYIPAQKQPDGTLKIKATRASERLQSMAHRVEFWINSQLTDWDAMEVAAHRSPLEFGHLVPDEEADSTDGMRCEFSHTVEADEEIYHLVRRSSPGEHISQGTIDNIENVSQYQPLLARGYRGQLGTFRKLARDPTFSDGRDSVTEGLLSGYWTLETPKAERGNPTAVELRDCLERDISALLTEQFIREFVVACFEDGFGTWEIVDRIDGGVAELAPINANTLDLWITDPLERELERLRFNTGRRQYEIPIEHMLLYSHHRTGANFEGLPQVRSCAGYIEMKQAFARLTGFAGEVHGLGIKTIENTNPEITGNNSEGSKIVEIFSELTAEDNPVIELPAGRTFKWHSPTAGQPNFLPFIEWLDQQIAKPATASGTLVGFQQFGSKALAEVKDDEKLRSTIYYGLLLGRLFDRDIIPRIARRKYGWDGCTALPSLGYTTQRQVRDPDRHARLVSYVGAQMLTWTRHDEERLRSEEGLPALPPEVQSASEGGAAAMADPVDPREAGAAAYNAAVHGETEPEAPASVDPLPEDLMSMRDAAQAMGVPTHTISALCRRGNLRFWQLGRHRQVSLADVRDLARTAASSVVGESAVMSSVNDGFGQRFERALFALKGPRYMLALLPPPEFETRVRGEAAARGLSTGERLLHVTLVYLGHRPLWESPVDLQARIRAALAVDRLPTGSQLEPPRMRVSGAGMFFNDHERVAQLLVGGPGLVELRTLLQASMSESGLLPHQRHGFIPHMTLQEFHDSEVAPSGWEDVGEADYPDWVADQVALVRDDQVVDTFNVAELG